MFLQQRLALMSQIWTHLKTRAFTFLKTFEMPSTFLCERGLGSKATVSGWFYGWNLHVALRICSKCLISSPQFCRSKRCSSFLDLSALLQCHFCTATRYIPDILPAAWLNPDTQIALDKISNIKLLIVWLYVKHCIWFLFFCAICKMRHFKRYEDITGIN